MFDKITHSEVALTKCKKFNEYIGPIRDYPRLASWGKKHNS